MRNNPSRSGANKSNNKRVNPNRELILKNKKKSNHIEIKENKTIIMKSFKVKEETPLLEFLFLKITNDSRNNIKHLLSNKQILVDGACITQFNFMLFKDDLVQIARNPVKESKKIKIKLDIIYEDDELIAINKPSGLLSIESDNETSNTAYRLVMDHVREKDKNARIFVVHRIDKETSGVLLFAKNEMLKNTLQHKWQDIVIKREYIAICEGTFKEKSGTVKSYLKTNVNNLMFSSKFAGDGQLSITHYQVIKENNKYSLVDVNIDTGRKNQIRVHMGDLGHKIIGDKKYSSLQDPIARLGLHAYKLFLIHPISKKELHFVAKIPQVFESLF